MAAAAKRRGRSREAGANGDRATSGAHQRTGTLSRWGNSLGVRIPREAVERLGLEAGARVTVELGEDSITIRPARARRKWHLRDLLQGVTPSKVGGEFNWGDPVGKERL